MRSIRTITAFVVTGALVAGGASPAFAHGPGAGAGTGADYPSDAGSQSQTQRKRAKKKPRRLSDAQLTRVATALGTTLDALKAAQAEVKAAAAATEARETRAQMDALLAEALNVTVAQLRAAFASVRGSTDGTCKPRPAGGGGTSPGTYPGDAA